MKKWISMLMAILMTLSLLPTAWAANVDDVSSTAEAVREEAVPQVNLPEEEDQQPEPALEMEMEETAPAPLSTSGDIDALLVDKGFAVPALGQHVGVDVPAWDNSFAGLAELGYFDEGEVAEATLTLKTATAEAWNAAYRQSNQWFPGVLNEVRCVFSYYAPAGADNFSFCIADENSSELSDFINGIYTNTKSAQEGCDMGFPIAEIKNVDGQERICSTTPYTLYYLVVWRDSSNKIVGRYALKVNIKTEEFSYPTGSETVMTALKNAGFNTAPAWGSLVEVDMPDGLVENTDYTLCYDSATGHISIKLMPGDPDHWMRAYETLLQWNEKERWTEGNSMFYAMLGFPNPASANEVLMFPGNCTLGTLANNNTYDWSKASDIQMSGAKTGWTLTMGSAEIDENGNALISFEKGVVAAGYYAVAYGDRSGSLVGANQEPKRAVSVSIEVTENFGYQWNTRIDEQLKAAGFVAPEIDETGAGTLGALILELPAGLEKGVDYNYTYNRNTGELNITILQGSAANWKTAYLDSVIGEEANSVDMGILFQSVADSTQGFNWCSWNENDLWALLQDDIWDDSFSFNEATRCGNGCWMADAQDNGNGTVTIGCEEDTQQFYQAALWKNENGKELARYLIKVTVNYSAFSHTVEALSMNKLNAADATRFELELENPNSFMTTILKNGKVTLVPRAGAVLTDKWDDIGAFRVKAPAGYTLQSCYISYSEGHNEIVREFDPDDGYRVPIRMEDANTDGHTQLILRWKNNNANAADLIEVLDVYVDSGWGNLSNHDGQPNATDVQAMYEYLTQNTVPYAGEDACDVNLDGAVDVYDLQYLYEFVAGI